MTVEELLNKLEDVPNYFYLVQSDEFGNCSKFLKQDVILEFGNKEVKKWLPFIGDLPSVPTSRLSPTLYIVIKI